MSTKAQRDTMLEMGLQGASQKMIWSQLGISASQAETLKKNDPDFAEALDLALVHSQSYWESMLLANLENKGFNSRLAEIALRTLLHTGIEGVTSYVQHLTLARDGTIYCYASPSGTSYTLFKSGDGGYSWSSAGKVTDAIVDIATDHLLQECQSAITVVFSTWTV